MSLREDADRIMRETLDALRADTALRQILADYAFMPGRLILVAVGKAAWKMADTAAKTLGQRIGMGIVITKYGHSQGPIANFRIREAGHPTPDEAGFSATQEALSMVKGLSSQDTVLFLLSGGGSALFEQPLIPGAELQGITQQLLRSGADIVEMNTIRKRLSGVKGGRFAARVAPARMLSVVLSDVLGDRLDMIASGPAYPDSSTSKEALSIAEKYSLTLSPAARECLRRETPKILPQVETVLCGGVKMLCQAVEQNCLQLGYRPLILTDSLCCQAAEAGSMLASIARYYQDSCESLAFIAGGETVVKVCGDGLGGRNQELALAAAEGIAGLSDTAVFSFGSDGTDGPTDAAGGFVDGTTRDILCRHGVSIFQVLRNNDAYHALEQCGGLLKTGPTGTNVNDVSVLLIRRQAH